MQALQTTLKDAVAEVLGANDIVDVLGGYLELQSAGASRFKSLCPFHQEKTPSFIVSRDRQTFFCFGCERGGDAITFLRDHEGLSFNEALQKLADRAGIRVPEYGGRGSDGGEQRTQLLNLSKMATRFYLETLQDPEKGRSGREYLDTRRLGEKTVARFELGYALNEWGALHARAVQDQYEDRLLSVSGLMKRGERGGLYDTFRNRLMFPIRDTSGNVVAFGGRDLGDSPAKYMNSPESPLYKKGRVLYGLYEAREAIRQTGRIVLVEGYFDVLRCFDSGIENVVAPCGTALTAEQASLIRRYCQTVVVVFDGDEAGVRAALRSIAVLTSAGLTVQALMLPEGMDPDDYVKREGPEAFSKRVDEAFDFVTFFVRMSERKTRTIEGRTEVARELFTIFKEIDDSLRRDEYLKLLARELGLSVHRCTEEFGKFIRESSARARVPHEPSPETEPLSFDDTIFVASLMENEILVSKVGAFMSTSAGMIRDGALREVLFVLTSEGGAPMQRIQSDAASRLFAAAASAERTWGPRAESLVDERLVRFKRDDLASKSARLQEEIGDAQRLKNEAKVDELTLLKIETDREIEKTKLV